jgi:hypothetical protein
VKRAANRWGAFDGVDNDAETVALMRAALRKVGGGNANGTIGGGIANAPSASTTKAVSAASNAVRARGERSGSKSASAPTGAARGRIAAAL